LASISKILAMISLILVSIFESLDIQPPVTGDT